MKDDSRENTKFFISPYPQNYLHVQNDICYKLCFQKF